jgi:hypothetical protein
MFDGSTLGCIGSSSIHVLSVPINRGACFGLTHRLPYKCRGPFYRVTIADLGGNRILSASLTEVPALM